VGSLLHLPKVSFLFRDLPSLVVQVLRALIKGLLFDVSLVPQLVELFCDGLDLGDLLELKINRLQFIFRVRVEGLIGHGRLDKLFDFFHSFRNFFIGIFFRVFLGSRRFLDQFSLFFGLVGVASTFVT
jgi:hypothetical protein